jgi:hypothetical protein
LAIVPGIIISFKWKYLLQKIIDLKIVVNNPQLYFIGEKFTSEQENLSDSHELYSLKKSIEGLMPFRIDVSFQNGEIQYVNPDIFLNITATKFQLTIADFSNRQSLRRPCTIKGNCLLCGGTADVNAVLIPLETTLTTDVTLELKAINLVLLNNILRKYFKVDLDKGTLDLYAELVTTDNSFKGYVKPLLKDLDFISAEDRSDSILPKIWERIVAGFYNVLENNRTTQVATKIPIDGRLDDPNVRVGVAIAGIFRNAFVKALTPSLDNTINLKSMWKTARSGTKEIIKAIFKKIETG